MADRLDSFYWKVLVVRCQIGDATAFEELVAACQSRLRGFLFKLVAGQEAVDDVAQEVWLDVFRDLPKLVNPDAFLPWFYRIARNRAYRRFRRRAPAVQSLDAQDLNVAEEQNSVEEFTAEDAQAVHAALDQLGPEHREVLLLRFIEDMSYDDIAAVVGCQVGTVKSRLHHAKRGLRAILEKTHDVR
ncbi:MAG TPA: sigma-70 family RNA polymerase sigma factor [Pirellulales bacterium]|jgi:RNA polymerase sigma-70 factor (ECF subfamily)|nr:sigma-70 family RNA polymerase sigma factor [Pirellulales bacterium]